MYCRAALVAGCFLWTSTLLAQQPRIQFPQPAGNGPPNLFPAPPVQGGVPGGPGATLGAPSFDPYAGSANVAPSLMGPPAGTPYGSAPYGAPPPRTSPFGNLFGQPQPPPAGYGAGTQPWNVTPNPYPGQEPSSLYPNGLGIGPPEWNSADALRLFQNLRIRETWLAGGGDRAMQINDFEIATTVQFPNFFGSTQPLLISPNFVLHTWDGPKPPILTHMPPLAYSAAATSLLSLSTISRGVLAGTTNPFQEMML